MAVPEHRKKVIDDLVDKLKAEYDVGSQSALNNLARQNGIVVYQHWDVILPMSWATGDKTVIAFPLTLSQSLNMFYLANSIGNVRLNRSFDTFSFANQSNERKHERWEETEYFAKKLTGCPDTVEWYLIPNIFALWLRRPLLTVSFMLSGNIPQSYCNSLYRRAMALKQKTEANIPPK